MKKVLAVVAFLLVCGVLVAGNSNDMVRMGACASVEGGAALVDIVTAPKGVVSNVSAAGDKLDVCLSTEMASWRVVNTNDTFTKKIAQPLAAVFANQGAGTYNLPFAWLDENSGNSPELKMAVLKLDGHGNWAFIAEGRDPLTGSI